jgi:hypothetical protein
MPIGRSIRECRWRSNSRSSNNASEIEVPAGAGISCADNAAVRHTATVPLSKQRRIEAIETGTENPEDARARRGGCTRQTHGTEHQSEPLVSHVDLKQMLPRNEYWVTDQSFMAGTPAPSMRRHRLDSALPHAELVGDHRRHRRARPACRRRTRRGRRVDADQRRGAGGCDSWSCCPGDADRSSAGVTMSVK